VGKPKVGGGFGDLAVQKEKTAKKKKFEEKRKKGCSFCEFEKKQGGKFPHRGSRQSRFGRRELTGKSIEGKMLGGADCSGWAQHGATKENSKKKTRRDEPWDGGRGVD